MARGKIQIKRIDNKTNRQVTYSKRRNGLFKKATELTVLCDARVSIIMISSTNRFSVFTSPNTTTKAMYDLYQKTKETDIWSSQYEKMQEELGKLKDGQRNLQMEIRRRMGYCLEGMSMQELVILQQDIENAVTRIRERKYKSIELETIKKKKKVKNEENIHRDLMQAFETLREDPQYGMIDYEHVLAVRARVDGLRLIPTEPNAPSAAGSCLTTYTYLE